MTTSGNVSQLPKIIHSTQSCISNVKAWMTNTQLQLKNDKTKMILTATKKVSLQSVPQFINVESSNIKHADTVCNPGVFYVTWNFVRPVKYATISLKSHQETVVCVCPFKIVFARVSRIQTLLQICMSDHVTLYFTVFTGYLPNRESNTN